MARTHRPTENTSRTHRLRSLALRVGGLCLLLLGLLAGPQESEAKLDPYYILRGQSFAQFQPRILLVLDTSGSMTWTPTNPAYYCSWGNCEGTNLNTSSRLWSARVAIKEVVDDTKGQADYSLMTFGHAKPPANRFQVPTFCTDNYRYNSGWVFLGGSARFAWVRENYSPTFSFISNISNAWGGNGQWVLCGDNRPFPYLRHDNLGQGISVTNNQTGALPPAPFYKAKTTQGNYASWNNHFRKVQWMPRYLGNRFNLDCTDSTQQGYVDNSYGDYGNELNVSARRNNICYRDFYYWPYVDGFPGYSYNYGYAWDNYHEYYECNGSGTGCSWWFDQWAVLGVDRRDPSEDASLFAPFYSQAAIDNLPAANRGPLDEDDAENTVLGLTSDMDEGGIDAAGGTPWASAIGDAAWYVSGSGGNVTPLGSLTQSNAAFSHSDVASYLSFITTISPEDVCRPTVAVIISDGQPDPWSTEGGTTLFSRLAKLRKTLGVKTYVVGFDSGLSSTVLQMLQGMACSAAGSNSSADWAYNAPCYGSNDFDWDTCRDSGNPVTGCAWQATNPDQLKQVLVEIISGNIETEIPSGPGSSINEFIPDTNNPGETIAAQTQVYGYTESPEWRGHVVRGACTDLQDPDDPLSGLADYCIEAAGTPDTDYPETYDNIGPSGSSTGCGLSRSWDAGTCLQAADWRRRRVFSVDASNVAYRISNDSGVHTNKFRNELQSLGLLTPGNESAEAQAIAEFMLGKGYPNNWKLGGLANSSPVMVRRIPKPNPAFKPQVGIRDAHCAGRLLDGNTDVPPSLVTYANSAWASTIPAGGGLSEHYEYEEAVLVGTDMGLLHAFHLDSGNELFAFLPRSLLSHAAELTANGPANFGQPDAVEDRLFGISSTVNQAYAFDHVGKAWKHLGVFGFGKGGHEYAVLDLSHMGDVNNPFDVLWTTESSALSGDFDQVLGETWSRPAISYVAADQNAAIGKEPYAFLMFGSGYDETPVPAHQGRSLVMIDALTGQSIGELARLPAVSASALYDSTANFAAFNDAAVGTHCESGFWGEQRELYFADAAGRLYRWDLEGNFDYAAQTVTFPHTADSGGSWSGNSGEAIPLATFKACQSTNEFSCNVSPSNRGDVFVYSPAVMSFDRIDDLDEIGQPFGADRKDQFLVAMVSGSPYDDAIDGGDEDNDFHSSIYLMVDDHRTNATGGLALANGGGKTTPGTAAGFARLALSDITRTRTVQYPDGTSGSETRKFSKKARPIRAPRIRVTGLLDDSDEVVQDVEIYEITYTIYEPGDSTCDPKWYDTNEDEWVFDLGSTYEITLRLGVNESDGFNFTTGGAGIGNIGGGFGTNGALTMDVAQVLEGDCADGNCGPQAQTKTNRPCDPNEPANVAASSSTISMGWTEIDGFSPVEVPAP